MLVKVAADAEEKLALEETRKEQNKQTKQVEFDAEKKTQQQNANSEIQHELADSIQRIFSQKGNTIDRSLHGSAVANNQDAHPCD